MGKKIPREYAEQMRSGQMTAEQVAARLDIPLAEARWAFLGACSRKRKLREGASFVEFAAELFFELIFSLF